MSTELLFRFDFAAMGSPCVLALYVSDHRTAEKIAETAIEEVRRIEWRYSRYRSDGVLSQINRAATIGSGLSVDNETARLIDWAFLAHSQSDGLFDVTTGLLRRLWNEESAAVPTDRQIADALSRIGLEKISWNCPWLSFPIPDMEMDFGGLGKEYAADQAAMICRLAGVRHGLVDLGGDIAVIGPHPDGSPWRIGVRNPLRGGDAVATLFVDGGGVATSGDYERYQEIGGRRYSHVFDPKTGRPVESLPSVTVVAKTCLSAGVTSTIALLKGGAAPQWLNASCAHHLYVEPRGKLGGSIIAPGTRTNLRSPSSSRSETAPSTASFPGRNSAGRPAPSCSG